MLWNKPQKPKPAYKYTPKPTKAVKTFEDATPAEAFAKAFLDATLKTTVEREPRPFEFRVSGLPYCPILHLNALFNPEYLPPPEETQAFKFYTSIGTSVHDVIQTHSIHSPYGQHVYGKWICEYHEENNATNQTKLKCDYKIEDSMRPKTLVCPSCTKRFKEGKIEKRQIGYLKYGELDFKYKGLSGHMDQLLSQNPSADDMEWHGFEYKTSGQHVIDNPNFKPYPRHIMQIMSYVELLFRSHTYKGKPIFVKYITLGYFSRNRPNDSTSQGQKAYQSFTITITKKMRALAAARLDRWIDGHSAVQNYVKAMRAKNETQAQIHLKEIRALRPCHSMDDYVEEMKPAFFGKAHCPFVEKGVRSQCFGCDQPARKPIAQAHAEGKIKFLEAA